MKEFVTDDGRRFFIPDEAQRVPEPIKLQAYHCTCHEMMGNDFYFLPIGSCLRPNKTCDNTKGQSLA